MAEPNARGRCPSCDALPPSGASACPVCGAALPAPVDALVAGLEDLESQAEAGALVEELETLSEAAVQETAVADRTLGELEAAEEAIVVVKRRLAWEEADLSEFIRRVEARIAKKARSPRPLPRPSPAAGPILATSGLSAAVGLFLLPTSLAAGVLFLVVAVAMATGALAFRATPVPQ